MCVTQRQRNTVCVTKRNRGRGCRVRHTGRLRVWETQRHRETEVGRERVWASETQRHSQRQRAL